MARNFDFKKYKAIVDYIQGSTGGITTSIDNLLKGSIELRRNSVASIVKYSTSIKEVVIGRLTSTIRTDIWASSGDIKLAVIAGTTVSFEEDYKYEPDSMLPSSINPSILNAIGEKFVRKSSGEIVLQREYSPSVTTFADGDIPSILFLKENYVTKQDGTFYGKVILASDSKSNRKSAVNGIIAEKLSGTSKEKKEMRTYSKKVLSNFFDVADNGKISMSSNPTALVVGPGVVLSDAPTEKSLITSSNIYSAAVRKDLSNMTPCVMETSGVGIDKVLTEDDAMVDILSIGTITEDVHTLPKDCQPGYTTSIIHASIEDMSNNSVLDKYGVIEMEGILNLDKEQFRPTEAVSMFTRLFALTPLGHTPAQEDVVKARGKTASTIKLVYEMVASRLLIENRGLFIDNREYLNQVAISSLLLKPTSSPEFNRRPVLQSLVNDIATVRDLSDMLNGITSSTSTGKVRSW